MLLIVIEVAVLLSYKHLLVRVHTNGQRINGSVLPELIHDIVPRHLIFCKLGDGAMILSVALFAIVLMLTGDVKYLGFFLYIF